MKHIETGRIAINTKFIPATNNRGYRIKASGGEGDSITINQPCNLSGVEAHYEAAKALCEKMSWGIDCDLLSGVTGTGYVFVFLK